MRDYIEVFLSYARLYVFADKYDIRPLKTLAALESSIIPLLPTLSTAGRPGISVLCCIYANNGDSTGGGGDLRTMLRGYVGYEMTVLLKDGGFKDLMVEDGGPLLGDFA